MPVFAVTMALLSGPMAPPRAPPLKDAPLPMDLVTAAVLMRWVPVAVQKGAPCACVSAGRALCSGALAAGGRREE